MFSNTGQYAATFSQVIPLQRSVIPWQRFWEIICGELRRHRFTSGTLRLYRTVLRNFARGIRGTPGSITHSEVQAYIWDLADTGSSWSWVASNICVLRAVFDKLGGMKIATRLVTPKRPVRLPEILNSTEILTLFKSAIRPRDRLLLALAYGCGLRTSEVCNLKWQDIDTGRKIINIPASYHVRARQLAIPEELCAAFIAGKQLSTQSRYVFTGNNANRPLCTRTLQQVIREIARKAGIGKPVTAMTLRHTYAVHLLEMGVNIREVQEQLGHSQIDTTLIYQKCFLPKGARSPLDNMKVADIEEPDTPVNQPPEQTQPKQEHSVNLPPLFDGQSENGGFEFPLKFHETPLDKAYAFYEVLKARITNRLLLSG
jgi:site-specific recombinase XerD